MRRIAQWFAVWLALGAVMAAMGGTVESYAEKVSNLVDPAKLKTLGARGANPRVQKYVALLADGEADGVSPEKVASRAVALAGMKGKAGKLTVDRMVRNLKSAKELGCLDKEGLREMRRGEAATVRRAPYKGDHLSVDHIIPRAVTPELDNVIANLALMPLRVNESKRAAVGERQKDLAKKLYKAGLLSRKGLREVMGEKLNVLLTPLTLLRLLIPQNA